MKSFDKTESFLIGIALCMFLLCMYGLLFDVSINLKESNQPILGQITFLENDTRHQQMGSMSWEPAKAEQQIHLGDRVFTGPHSRSQVAFIEGGHVDLGENTLLFFAKIRDEQIPNFVHGNFRLQVNGEIKFAIDGEVAQIKGNNSEVQIYLDRKSKRPQVKVLKGKASVKQGTGPTIELNADRFTTLRSSASPTEPRGIEKDQALKTKSIRPNIQNETLLYTYQFHDFYEIKDSQIVRKTSRPTYVNFTKNISWFTEGHVRQVSGQLSSTEGFDTSVLSFKSDESTISLAKVFLGDNFWRLSLDEKNWTSTEKFFVQAVMLDTTPKIRFSQKIFVISNDIVTAKGVIESPPEISNFVIEYSRSPEFSSNATRINWRQNRSLALELKTPGRMFLRVRGVNSKMEITKFSDVVEIQAELATREGSRLAGEKFKIGPNGHARGSLKTQYQKITKIKDSPVRKPSAIPQEESTIKTNISNEIGKANLGLESSRLQLEGAVFAMHAQEKEDRSNVLAFTGRTINWWDSHGFEGSLKSKAASLSKGSDSPSPLQLEVRYHYRWLLPYHLFSSSGSTQFSLIAGYELYRNSTVGYSPQYDLVKTGFSVDLPVFTRWDTGGEVLYGYGLDQSKKYEISGRVNYYLQRNWSMGVGYRLHLFEAGSDKSAPPMGAPYREGYGEGYSVLRWHY